MIEKSKREYKKNKNELTDPGFFVFRPELSHEDGRSANRFILVHAAIAFNRIPPQLQQKLSCWRV